MIWHDARASGHTWRNSADETMKTTFIEYLQTRRIRSIPTTNGSGRLGHVNDLCAGSTGDVVT